MSRVCRCVWSKRHRPEDCLLSLQSARGTEPEQREQGGEQSLVREAEMGQRDAWEHSIPECQAECKSRLSRGSTRTGKKDPGMSQDRMHRQEAGEVG